MTEQKAEKLKWLEQHLPEGLLVDARWMTSHGYSTALRSQYVAAGWLEQPAREVYRRKLKEPTPLSWQQVVISLQTVLLRDPLCVGGRTALEMQGYAHYLPQQQTQVHLYGPKPPPSWLGKLPLDVRFVYHNSEKLFRNEPVTRGTTSVNYDVAKNDLAGGDGSFFTMQRWGASDWPLTLSTPERAVFEVLDELPDREGFEHVNELFQGLTNLRPDRLKKLLHDCKNVKVKRLFFFFADRHKHAWLKRLDKSTIDLGKGDRALVKGGKLDLTYRITVPEDL